MYPLNLFQNYFRPKGPKTNKISFKISISKIKKRTFKITNTESLKTNAKAISIPVIARVKTPANNVQVVPDIIYELMTTYFVLLEK